MESRYLLIIFLVVMLLFIRWCKSAPLGEGVCAKPGKKFTRSQHLYQTEFKESDDNEKRRESEEFDENKRLFLEEDDEIYPESENHSKEIHIQNSDDLK